MKKVLTPAAVGEIWRLREELDDWGEPKWSGEQIAEQIGVSESTVWRVLRKKAAYRKEGPAAQTKARFAALETDTLGVAGQDRPDMEQRAAESARQVLEGLREVPVDPLGEMSEEAKAKLGRYL
jgi:transcriptional regulator with XRE-family HTH domain